MKNCIETLQKKHEVTLRELMQRQQQKDFMFVVAEATS